jgi:hypothetical protein
MDWQKVRDQFPATREYIFLDLAKKCTLRLFSPQAIQEHIRKQQDTSGERLGVDPAGAPTGAPLGSTLNKGGHPWER